jgi:diguanylate cyclase (GGDEF)-like protein
MPNIDGVALCRKIRSSQDAGYVYFILLTGKDKKEDIIEGLGAGADDYLTKPFDREELQVRVRTGERILNLEKALSEKNRELHMLNIKLEELIRLDPLMNIGNRRSFYETIQRIHHRASRYEHVYGVVMCDIDNFKSYNDTYGHIAGDSVLRSVANAIKQCLRISDDVFRYGGEEIVLVLPDQDLDSCVRVAERIRNNVEALQIEHKVNRHGVVTVSCGAAAFDMANSDGKWESVLELADRALYSAKEAGRNRVCVATG